MARSDETNQTGTTRAGARDIQQHERMSHARRASGDWGELDLKVPNPFQDWGGDGDPSQLQTVTTWAQSGESRIPRKKIVGWTKPHPCLWRCIGAGTWRDLLGFRLSVSSLASESKPLSLSFAATAGLS
eukprot:1247327-Rhodomonas_salina.1